MTVGEAVEILRAKVGLEEQTINFLLCYKYGEELVKKLAIRMEQKGRVVRNKKQSIRTFFC